MTTEQTSLFIKNLKNRLNSSQSRLSQTLLSTTKDTALWEIEALLNYDFDNAQNPVPSNTDTLNYDLNINSAGNIDYSEISNAYNTLSGKINLHLSANTLEKVKLIDISAVETNNIIQVKAYVVYTIDNSGHKVATSPCDPITISGHFANALGIPGIQCSTETNHGPTMCNVRLNCSPYTCSSGARVFYTNITSVTYNVNSNSNMFHYNVPYTGDCAALYLSASQLNNNVSNAKSYTTSNMPSSPSGLIISNYNFTCNLGQLYPGAPTWTSYWKLQVTYGTPNCWTEEM